MARITSEILAAIAPQTAKTLRDRFLDALNSALPVYAIDSELEVAAFLTTACFESDHFKTLREYGKGKGRAYGKPDKITGLVYYGRGIFQNTWKKGYQDFTDYVAENWDSIRKRAGAKEAPNFVENPELLATVFWAVEAACWYWQKNHLAKYADKGLDGFFGLQGLVNRGSATKRALDYPERLQIYKAARSVLPDDFVLDSAVAPAAIPSEKLEPEKPTVDQGGPPEIEQPPTNQGGIEQTVITGGDTTAVSTTVKNQQDVNEPVVQENPGLYNDIGFKQTIINDAKKLLPANLGFQTIPDAVGQINGMPDWAKMILVKLAWIALVVTIGWALYRVISWLVFTWKENERVKLTALINTDVNRKNIEFVEPNKPEAQKA